MKVRITLCRLRLNNIYPSAAPLRLCLGALKQKRNHFTEYNVMKLSNTATRIIVSVVAIPLIIYACLTGQLFFLGFILAIGLAASYELAVMAKNKIAYASMPVVLSGTAALILNAYFDFIETSHLLYIIVALLLIFELFRNKGSAIVNTGTALTAILYPGLFASAIVEIREFYRYGSYTDGAYLIIAIMVAIWVCDSAAFFVGSAIGKHKMFPRVSPKKSWEGAIAGFVFAVIAMVALKFTLLDFISGTVAIVSGVIVGSIGQIGDLTESLFKRDAGVKDSSSLIPGHGGVFDRFDSLLLTAPVIYLVLYYLQGR